MSERRLSAYVERLSLLTGLASTLDDMTFRRLREIRSRNKRIDQRVRTFSFRARQPASVYSVTQVTAYTGGAGQVVVAPIHAAP
jgi:hypothetical protein